MKKTITWIVVADHQHARFFGNDGSTRNIEQVESPLGTHIRRSHEILSDRSGRAVSSRDGRRHGMELHTDPHRQEALAFVGQVADVIVKSLADGRFDRLILIAPPRALGEFRKALPSSVRAKIVHELPEDLTKADRSDIAGRLTDHIAT